MPSSYNRQFICTFSGNGNYNMAVTFAHDFEIFFKKYIQKTHGKRKIHGSVEPDQKEDAFYSPQDQGNPYAPLSQVSSLQGYAETALQKRKAYGAMPEMQ